MGGCGGGDGGGGSVTNVTKTVPDYVEKAGQEIYERGKGISNKPFQQYTGARIAPLHAMQQSGMDNILRSHGQYNQPMQNNISKLEQQYSTPYDRVGTRNNPQAIRNNRFTDSMNNGMLTDYMQKMYDPAARVLNKESANAMANFQRQADLGGMRNHSASALRAAEMENGRVANLEKLGMDTFREAANLFNNDEERALKTQGMQADIFERDIARELQSALANQGAGLQNKSMNMQAANSMLSALQNLHKMNMMDNAQLLQGGALGQKQQQREFDSARDIWDEKENYDKHQTEWLASLLKLNPGGTQTSTQTQDNGGGPDGFTQFMSAAIPLGLSFLSDVREKENIVKIGEKDGINIYEYSYIGDSSRYRGVMAQEVEHIPGAVHLVDGVKAVDYSKLNIPFEKVT